MMRPSVLVVGVTVAAALASSSTARADGTAEGVPASTPMASKDVWTAPTTQLQESPRPRYVAPQLGAGIFLLSYATSVVVAIASTRKDDDYLYIPLVGPWLDLGHRDCDAHPCSAQGFTGAMLIVDGVAQAIGVLTFLAATVQPAEKKTRILSEERKIHVSPARIGRDAYGLTAVGAF